MTPKELKSLMHRTRSSSLMIAPVLGISSVQIRRWRSGTRPIPECHLDKLEAFFRERGARPPETPRTVDPRAVTGPPVEHRIAVEKRDPPLPPASTDSLIGAINGALAMLLRPGAPQRPAEGRQRPPSPATAPKVPASAPAPQRPPAGAAAAVARCQSPISGEPGVVSGPCQQFAAPGSRFCAMHARGQRG